MKVRLEGTEGVLDLNGIDDYGLGYQALAGANFFGLPPLSSHWIEGAGDGAFYRGARVPPREGDLPIDILARDGAHLKQLISKLAKTLASPCELVVTASDGTEWGTTVVRIGGGNWSTGIDTRGTRDLQMVLTLRAGDPYFTSRTISTIGTVVANTGSFLSGLGNLVVAPGQALGALRLENTGDVHAYPVWSIVGPGDSFMATSPSGEVLHWKGSLGVGETLTINTKNATVIDGTGANRYAELGSPPKFWAIPAGLSTANVSFDNITSASRLVCQWQARVWSVI